jgi:hypothetical protein
MKNNVNNRKKVRAKRNKQKKEVAAHPKDRKHVTMHEFKEWTVEWLGGYIGVATQEPHVITNCFPVCVFMKDMVHEQMYLKDASLEQLKGIFYKTMLSLYWGALGLDEGDQQWPYLQNNFKNVIPYAIQCLSEWEYNDESAGGEVDTGDIQ